LLGAVAQVRQGLGVGFLPHELFREDPDMVWCFTPPQEKSQTWLVTHERLRKVARIRALLDFIAAYNSAAKARAPLSAL
jgi:DNA-binding transcriptional LysR family regulator